MKNLQNSFRHLFYLSIIFIITFSINGCFGSEEETADRHVPGVYTGTFNGSPMTIVIGEEAVTRLVITVNTPAATSIDITGSWPLVWNDDDNCYDFIITTTAGSEAVIIDGVAGIDVDDVPTVQGSVKVDGVDEGAFYLYL